MERAPSRASRIYRKLNSWRAAGAEAGVGITLETVGKEIIRPHFPLAGTIVTFTGAAIDGGSIITCLKLAPGAFREYMHDRREGQEVKKIIKNWGKRREIEINEEKSNK